MGEYWDLYDERRESLGKTHLRGEPLGEGAYHIVVNVWIINDKDEILLTQRHPKKDFWGGLWECSASGAVLAGEDSMQGAIREAEEEIGVILLPSEIVLIESIMRVRERDFRDTFLVRKNIPIYELKFHPEEIINAKWVTKKEYDDMCNEGLLAPPVKNFWEIYRPE